MNSSLMGSDGILPMRVEPLSIDPLRHCRCIKAGKWQTAGKADAWMLPREGHRVFDGLCIFLHGDAATLEPMRRLLPYAGGLWDLYTKWKLSGCGYVSLPPHSSCPA